MVVHAEARAPAPVASADEERTRRYLRSLGRARKATVAKDFPAAISQFDAALAAEPNDARALAERGYASLLAGDLETARQDLVAAERRAADTALLRQILYNQATIAERLGDAIEGKKLRDRRDALAAAAKTKAGADCTLSVERPGTAPVEVATYREAYDLMKTRHFGFWNSPVAELETPAITAAADEAAVRLALIGEVPPGDGAWTVVTESGGLSVGHVLFRRGERILIHPALGGFQMGRCPFGDSPPEVKTDPLRIQVDAEELGVGYICFNAAGDQASCDDLGEDGGMQSYCAWQSSTFRTRLLDPKTLAIVLDITETAQADRGDVYVGPKPRSVLTFQPAAVLITGCSEERRETLP